MNFKNKKCKNKKISSKKKKNKKKDKNKRLIPNLNSSIIRTRSNSSII